MTPRPLTVAGALLLALPALAQGPQQHAATDRGRTDPAAPPQPVGGRRQLDAGEEPVLAHRADRGVTVVVNGP